MVSRWTTKFFRLRAWLSHPGEERHHSIERIYWLLSCLLSIAVAGGAFASAIYAREAVLAGWRAVAEARRQASAAEKQLTQSEAASRPYVIAQIKEDRLTTGGPERVPAGGSFVDTYTATLSFKNFGTTPAIITHFEGGVILAEEGRTVGLSRGVDVSENDYDTALILSQDKSTPEYEWKRPVVQLEKQRLSKDTLKLYLTGEVQYNDVFGKSYRYAFCYLVPTHSGDLRTRLVPASGLGCSNRNDKS